MRIGYFSFIFFLVLFKYCILLTWSTSDETDRDCPLERSTKLSWKRFLNLRKSETAPNKAKEDRKGKGIAIGGSSAAAGSFTEEKYGDKTRWSDERRGELLRYFYVYREMGACSGRKRDWDKLAAIWAEKHGHIRKRCMKSRAFTLRERILNSVDPSEGGIKWTDRLNDELMRIYYVTETGNSLEHGERMHAEWVKMKYPGYEHITPEILLNRAKMMIRSAKNIPLGDLNRGEVGVLEKGQRLNWGKDIDNFLLDLWIKIPMNIKGRKEKIYREAVKELSILRDVGVERLYSRMHWLYNMSITDPKTSSEIRRKVFEQKEAQRFIVDGNINWKKEHDHFLTKLWNNISVNSATKSRPEAIYRAAVQKFSELYVLRPDQVYSRAKYLRRKAHVIRKSTTVGQGTTQGTHVQYHTFIDDQMIPSFDQGTHHDHEWIASTSLEPGPSHQQPDLKLGLDTLSSGGQSPDTNLRLG